MKLVINGSAIHDIPSFYREINRVFMTGEDWQIGQSLDAFDDLLHGGFGVLKNAGKVGIIWQDMPASREALGYDTTRAYYQSKLAPGSPFNRQLFLDKLRELEAGTGQTYFDIVLEIIAGHPNLVLTEA